MASSIGVYFAGGNRRSKIIAEAVYKGVRIIGERAVLQDAQAFRGVNHKCAIFYGLGNGLKKVFEEYKSHATAIYIDLGYWHRRIRDRYDGYHKIAVNSRHPTTYFQQRRHNDSRFKKLGLEIAPWRKKGGRIILAGMSEKAAKAEGLAPFVWEQNARRELSEYTKREIVYRPKPNCIKSRPLPKMGYDKNTSINRALLNAHAVVTRHSNVGVDALLRGVPVFAEAGVASVLGLHDLSQIECPYFPDDREQWAADVAWCQFTVAEMATGLPWRHLKDEGLMP